MERPRWCRRRQRSRWPESPSRRVWSLGGLLLLFGRHPSVVEAGRMQVSWPSSEHPTAMTTDAEGSMVVCGCLVDDEALYVARFTAKGEPLWREQMSYHDFQPFSAVDGDQGEGSVCAAALATDAAMNIYITGTARSSPDTLNTDVFVARFSSAGSLVWKQTIATPYPDRATSVRVDDTSSSLFVGGSSRGNVALGALSSANCDAGCDGGFVARLHTLDGSVDWTQPMTGRGARETRVFDLAVDSASQALVVVGETQGSQHADVFVRRLDMATGATQWTTQLDSTAADICQLPASTSSSSSYTRLYPRGRCALAFDGSSREISVVGTTLGLLTTFPSQRQQYLDLCGITNPTPCMQLFVARLALETGAVRWIRQLVHRAQTSAERGLRSGSDGLAVLGTASAGFFAGAERMEQLLVLRVASDGVVQWTAQVGLDGEDHAVDIGGTEDLFVLAHGSDDQSRRGTTSSESYIRRLRPSDGAVVPVCLDSVGVDERLVPNITRDPNLDLLVEIPVRRASFCVGTEASVRYRYEVAPGAESSPCVGYVHFKETQENTRVAITVPALSTVLRIFLEAASEDAAVDAAASQQTLDLEMKHPEATSNAAADGRLWQEITWIFFVASLVATGLLVVLGRLCWRGSKWSWRRAKIFQYKTLRLRGSPTTDRSNLSARPTSGFVAVSRASPMATTGDLTAPAKATDHEDETDELRTHLEEIQHLNDALDGLLSLHASRVASLVSSPHSSLPRQPASPKRSKPRRQWKLW